MHGSARLLRMAVIGSSMGIVCAALALDASAADTSGATLFYDAHVFTAEYDHPYAEAVAIRGDRIVAVGALGAVERAAGPNARRIDLHGAFLMPGLIDAHVHPIMAGVTLIQANFTDQSGSIPALVQAVAAEMNKHESMRGDVLIINSLSLNYWPHAAEIDAALSHGAYAQTADRAGRFRWTYGLGEPGGAHACGHHAIVHPQSQLRPASLLWIRRPIQSEWLPGGRGQGQARCEPAAVF